MPTEQHLFSTGTLTAQVAFPSANMTISRGDSSGGGPTTPSGTSLSNLTDRNPSTTATCNSDGGGYEYFIVDLGAAQDISIVTLSNVTVGAGAICGVDISNTFSATGIPGISGDPGAEISLVAVSSNVSPVTDQNLQFVPLAGPSLNGRYIYISFTNHVSGSPVVTVGELAVSTAINFAVVQDAQVEIKWDCHELYTAASLSDFPIDIGVGESSWKITAHNIGIRADALQKIIAGQLSIVGSEATVLLPQTISMPPITGVFAAQDTNGNLVQFTMNNAKASGASIPFKLNDFAVQQFTLTAYPDVNGLMGTIVFG